MRKTTNSYRKCAHFRLPSSLVYVHTAHKLRSSMDGDLFDFHAHVRRFQSLWIIVQQQTSSNVLRCDFYSDSSETVARVESGSAKQKNSCLINYRKPIFHRKWARMDVRRNEKRYFYTLLKFVPLLIVGVENWVRWKFRTFHVKMSTVLNYDSMGRAPGNISQIAFSFPRFSASCESWHHM